MGGILDFQAYRRPNGTIGVRNHTLIIPTVACSSETAARIAARARGTVTFSHQHGCTQIGEDIEQTFRTISGIGCHPNVAAALIIGLGCETLDAEKLQGEIERTGKPTEMLIIQEEHGTKRTIEKGVAIAKKLRKSTLRMKKEPCQISELIVGLECGGSDATSGISANPALGVASDIIIRKGGTTILSETTELIGAEHIMARRAATPLISDKIYEIVSKTEQRIKTMKVDFIGGQPTPGNIRGGLTTIEEKSLGCICKAGTAQVQEVLEYAQKPSKKGLVIMDTPGHDVESITGMVAGGAHLIGFTTGQGTPVGSVVAPVIKITGNPRTFKMMKDDIDINAGTIIEGKESIEQVGKRIFNEITRVALGKETKAEISGFHEFAVNRIGPTL